MDPPRRPGSGWLQNTGGNSKNQPVLAPTPDGSKITRTVPLPADLVARNGGGAEDEETRRAERAKKAAEEREKEEEICAICYDQLPEVGRGIVACGHMYCFDCIHQWCKTQNDCPGCRFVIRRIIKTLSPEEVVEEKARKERMKQKPLSKKQAKAKRKAASVTTPAEGVTTKTIRIRPTSLKPTPAQQRAAPHPEAPGGWMYEEAQAALRRQQQEQQEQSGVHPVRARGALAAMADSLRQAEEREAVVRDLAAVTQRPSHAIDTARSFSPLPAEEPSAVPVSSTARARAREVALGQLAVAAAAAAAAVATSSEAEAGVVATVEAEAQRERMRAEEREGRSS